jgi:hypothetical protein
MTTWKIEGGVYSLKSGMMVTLIKACSGKFIVCSNLTGKTFSVTENSFK